MVSYRLVFPIAGIAATALGASHPVNNDVYAYPQFEVIFADSYIFPDEADALLAKSYASALLASASGSPTPNSDIVSAGATTSDASGDSNPLPKEVYELLDIASAQYLCSIPVIAPEEPQNATATELARENEAKELARASESGWDILKSMDGECLYFMSGWWSYKYCYDSYIVQFHAQTQPPGHVPPVPDPHMAAYVLGRASKQHHEDGNWLDDEWQKGAEDIKSSTTDMQIKGDQRFLVHKLTGGTMCDLTHRERTIEIQYHCDPGASQDSIAWIKEITTCAYLMVVNTPRLCKDAAFLPQKEIAANFINCREIAPDNLSPEEADAWFAKRKEEEMAFQEQQTAPLIKVKKSQSTTTAKALPGEEEDDVIEVMIEVDVDEMSRYTEEEFQAMAQKLVNEATLGLAKQKEHEAEKRAAKIKDKKTKDDVDELEQKKQALQKLVDSLGDNVMSEEMVQFMSEVIADPIGKQQELMTEMEDMLEAYMEMARNYVRGGKKVPGWLKDQIRMLQQSVNEDRRFQDMLEGKDTDEEESEAGSQEEYYNKKDEL